jgi:MFS family permease
MALTTLVNTVGNGMFLTLSALFFTRVVGLSITLVGLGLTVAGLVGLIGGVPIGHLADRRGPRGTYITMLVAQAAAMTAYLAVHSFWAFVVVETLGQLAQGGSSSAKGPIIRQLGGEAPARFRAYLRAVTNVGIAVGALAAGYVVELDSPTGYRVLVAINAASYLVAAVMLVRIPALTPMPAPDGGHTWVALRDRPYLSVTALNGVMSIQFAVLTLGVPLWVAGHTHAPRWTIAATMLVNTALIAVFQVRVGQGVDTPRHAGRVFRRAGWVFVASCALIAVAADVSAAWLAVTILLTAATVHTLGELWHQAGAFELGYGLAADHAQGQYQGVYGLGQGAATALGPAVIALCLAGGQFGWLGLGVGLALVGAAMPTVANWAAARRPGQHAVALPSTQSDRRTPVTTSQ